MPPELLPSAQGEEAGEKSGAPGEGPDPLEGFHLRPGSRGPESTLKAEMIPIIATALARYGVKRIAAAKAGTTEDCLDAWLRRGADAARRRKRSLYTELYAACEQAMAHRTGFLIELGDRTVMDRHTNPRWVTWALAVTAPKQFTVPKEGPAKTGGQLGPAFEMVTPAQAAQSLEEKLAHFLATEEKVAAILAEGAAAATGEPEGGT
jgi:hypothetical protein